MPNIEYIGKEVNYFMNAKIKSCFTPHVIMHSLFGLGLGLLLSALIPSLANVWLGIIIIVVALGLDLMRKG